MNLLGGDPAERWARSAQWGAWLLIGGLITFLLAVFSSGLFFYVVLVVGMALICSLAYVTVVIGGLRVDRELSDVNVAPGESVDVTLTVHNRKPVPAPWLLFRDQVEDGLEVDGGTAAVATLAAEQALTMSYTVKTSSRGLYRVGPSVTEASDPLGFVRRFKTDRRPGFITVFPEVRPIGSGWPLGHSAIHRTPRRRSLFEDPSRFAGTREYQPSDNIRRIHWRATARLGALQVKTFQPAVLQGALLVVDGSPSRDNELFELTVSAAASLSEYVLHDRQKVGLLSNGGDAADRYPRDGIEETFRHFDDLVESTDRRARLNGFRPLAVEAGKGSWQSERMLAALGRLVPAAGVTLAELLEIELPRLPRNLVAIVVTRTLDDELAQALDGLRRSGIEVSVVWIRSGRLAEIAASPLPDGVPLHSITDREQIDSLGLDAL